MSCGLIWNEEAEDLLLDESGAEQYRLTRNKLMSIKGKALLRKHCNSMKQLT